MRFAGGQKQWMQPRLCMELCEQTDLFLVLDSTSYLSGNIQSQACAINLSSFGVCRRLRQDTTNTTQRGVSLRTTTRWRHSLQRYWHARVWPPMTSSIQPEVHNVSQPLPRATVLGIGQHAHRLVKVGCVVSEICSRTKTRTRTHKLTRSSLCSATSNKSILWVSHVSFMRLPDCRICRLFSRFLADFSKVRVSHIFPCKILIS